jgi:hypothetical protein
MAETVAMVFWLMLGTAAAAAAAASEVMEPMLRQSTAAMAATPIPLRLGVLAV